MTDSEIVQLHIVVDINYCGSDACVSSVSGEDERRKNENLCRVEDGGQKARSESQEAADAIMMEYFKFLSKDEMDMFKSLFTPDQRKSIYDCGQAIWKNYNNDLGKSSTRTLLVSTMEIIQRFYDRWNDDVSTPSNNNTNNNNKQFITFYLYNYLVFEMLLYCYLENPAIEWSSFDDIFNCDIFNCCNNIGYLIAIEATSEDRLRGFAALEKNDRINSRVRFICNLNIPPIFSNIRTFRVFCKEGTAIDQTIF